MQTGVYNKFDKGRRLTSAGLLCLFLTSLFLFTSAKPDSEKIENPVTQIVPTQNVLAVTSWIKSKHPDEKNESIFSHPLFLETSKNRSRFTSWNSVSLNDVPSLASYLIYTETTSSRL